MTKHTKTDTTTEDHASTDEQPESIQLVADGVVIEKTAGAAADVDDVLTVSFDIKSERDETFELRLVEDLPAVAHGHDIGFHPEFDPDNWTITDGDRLVYEAVLHPREQRTTVYGIDGLAEAAGEIVSVRPAIETRASPEDAPIDTAPREVDPGEDPTGGIAPDEDPTGASPDEELAGDGSGVSDEATTGGFEYGEDEGPPGAPGDPMAEEGTLAGVDGNEEAPPTESRDSHDSRTSSTLPNDGSVLDALMVELTAAELSEANRELLREKLGLAPRNSLETKVRNLQNTVDDLIVYRDALEEFIDENGTADQVIQEFEEDLAELRSDVSLHRQSVDEVRSDIEGLDDRIADLASKQTDTHQDLRTRLDALETELAELEQSLKGDVRELRDDVDHGSRWRSEATAAFEEMTSLDATRSADD